MEVSSAMASRSVSDSAAFDAARMLPQLKYGST